MIRTVEKLFAHLSSASVAGSRNTALAPLHMVSALVLGAFLTGLWLMAPSSYLVFLATFCALALSIELGSYVYLLLYDRDALRSERFTLEKIRLEKGLIGDSMSGVREITTEQDAAELSTAPGDE